MSRTSTWPRIRQTSLERTQARCSLLIAAEGLYEVNAYCNGGDCNGARTLEAIETPGTVIRAFSP